MSVAQVVSNTLHPSLMSNQEQARVLIKATIQSIRSELCRRFQGKAWLCRQALRLFWVVFIDVTQDGCVTHMRDQRSGVHWHQEFMSKYQEREVTSSTSRYHCGHWKIWLSPSRSPTCGDGLHPLDATTFSCGAQGCNLIVDRAWECQVKVGDAGTCNGQTWTCSFLRWNRQIENFFEPCRCDLLSVKTMQLEQKYFTENWCFYSFYSFVHL